ncbi:MAG: hypothetical protein L0323_00180, partial [Planctomycetes bacterium]|nr:hypothetical protein [Planctomycetota bacterium]
LSRCDLVVLAKVEGAAEVGAATVGRLKVERALDGGSPAPKVSVLAPRGSLGEPDASHLYFLDRKGEERYGLVGRVAATDPDFASKVLLAQETLRIAALRLPAERLARAREMLHRHLAGEDPYLRSNAILELERWAKRFPRRLGKEDPGRIREVAGAARDPIQRRRLESLARAVEGAVGS